MARFDQLLHPNEPQLFSTGTDEHGLKVQKAAIEKGIQPKEFCDSISGSFKRLADSFDCNYNYFIRTSDAKHAEVVSRVWRKLASKGLIYKTKYEGWYCVSDESFVTSVEEKQVNGQVVKVSPESGHPVEWRSEENYMFKLSQFVEPIKKWLDSNPDAIKPNKFLNLVKSLAIEKDLSISRPRDRLSWGIPVPDDPSHTIYVWLDALINYLTVAEYPDGAKMAHWPPNVQVIGKDITKFHAIYWPAFLLALELPLPQKLLIHSHWQVDGVKMSKSLGNVVDPFEIKDIYSVDGVRYYLLRASSLQDDGNFSRKIMTRIVNSELADSFGNLLSRTVAPAINRSQVFPSFHPNVQVSASDLQVQIEEALNELPHSCAKNYDEGLFNLVVDEVMNVVRMGNHFYHQQAPWVLAKDPSQQDVLAKTIFTCLEIMRVTSIVLSPIVPSLSKIILNRLNVPPSSRSWSDACVQFDPHQPPHPLAPRGSIVYSRIK